MLSLLSVLVLTITVASALPTSQSITELQHVFPVVNSPTSTHPKRRPLVIWHGLGDTVNSDGISGLVQDIKDMLPGIYIHTVATPAGGSVDDERRAGFYGNASSQIDAMAATIQDIPELQEGFDGIGFSQGGLFMRDYVQRYNVPPVNNLLTVSFLFPAKRYMLSTDDAHSSAVPIWASLASSRAARLSTCCVPLPSGRQRRVYTPNGHKTT